MAGLVALALATVFIVAAALARLDATALHRWGADPEAQHVDALALRFALIGSAFLGLAAVLPGGAA